MTRITLPRRWWGWVGLYHVALTALATPAFAQGDDVTIPRAGVALHVKVFGPALGVPLIIIPGGPGLSLDYLLPLSRLVSPRVRVVLLDPRGAGSSTRPRTGDYTLAAQVADIEAIRLALGAPKIHLAGHSWGTIPALAYAGEHPQHIQSLLLLSMGAPTRVRDDRTFGPAFAARKNRLRQSNLLISKPAGDGCLASFNASLPAHFADPRHLAARAGLGGSYACEIGRIMVEAAGDWDFRAVITRFDRPILLLVGDADANLVGTRDTAGFADRADVTTVILPECGHFPWLECTEPFFRATTRFLEHSAR